MEKRDKQLGMGSDITRRDFLNGVGVAVGASLLPGCGESSDSAPSLPIAEYYPPALTGMRGSHPGSFEVAHGVVQGQTWDATSTDEHYDLVVVGAGISGLTAAYVYRRDVDRDARVLILDNHDDFGGHAKRNEFEVDGRTIVGFGGTMFMESPAAYPANAKRICQEIGIDGDFHQYHDWETYNSRGMGACNFFDKETFGKDVLIPGSLDDPAVLAEAPFTDEGKKDFERLNANTTNYLSDLTADEQLATIKSISYRDYLEQYGGFGDELLTYLQKRSHGIWAIGIDALPAWMAYIDGYAGFGDMQFDLGLEGPTSDALERSIMHFPDGNASIARLLVREMIPNAAAGSTMEDVVTARFDYSQLDMQENSTRLRLSSTVVGLAHQRGDLSADVDVTYVVSGTAECVTASRVIWAGYHALVPHICPDVSKVQARAQAAVVRAPLVYTNVLIRNWRSLEKLGMNRAYCPGSFFQSVMPDFPVSIGSYKFSGSPDDPIVLHLQHIPTQPGLDAADQFRAGRTQLLSMSFETFERNIRDQLGRMLGPGGFDPATDILAITVNRWPHGYAYATDPDSKEVAWWPDVWERDRKPWVEARQPVGNIRFAGTDSASDAMSEAAMEEAYRAVHSLKGNNT